MASTTDLGSFAGMVLRAAREESEGAEVEDAHLDRARTLITDAIRRRWEQGLIKRDADGVFTGYLGTREIDQLMQPRPAPERSSAMALDFVYPPTSPIGHLAAQLELTPTQADLLVVLLACETDPRASRLASYLGGNQGQFSVTVDLVHEIVYQGRSASQTKVTALLQRDLAPYGLLRRFQLVVVEGADNRLSLAQVIRLHPRLVDWIVRGTGLDADLMALAQLYPPVTPVGESDPTDTAAAVAALRAGDRLLLVEGLPRSGRQLLLQFAAVAIGRPLLIVSGRGLGPDKLVAAFREALLHDALLALRDAEDLLEGDPLLRFRECLALYPGSVAIVGTSRLGPRLAGLRPQTTVLVKVPGHADRFRLWREHLGASSGLSDDELRQISGLYNLGVSGIIDASRAARELATFAATAVRPEHVARAVRQIFEGDLSSVATHVEVSQTWDDIVLSDEIGESIVDIMDRIRLRTKVLGQWGFARKLGKGLGLTVLLSGEPGTGKSMVAGLIAKELGLDLYVVDLSRITSKWLGETEKNLARAFDAAEAGHVLLLFDEADSVLGKRTAATSSSNDRNANLETNFILARLEQFQGVAFFTTNLAAAIDPAVARRMTAHVMFTFPDTESRAELWRRMIPSEAPVAPNIDFRALADRYQVSGGFIRNIVVRAAYLASREGLPIGMTHLERAATLEYRERGALLVGGRLV